MKRIVVTGGPGGGKTTALDLFRREIGEQIVVVPEAATLLFGGGFPRGKDPAAQIAAQRAIFAVQRNLEAAQAALYPGRVLLCDRGTLDGAVYWPHGVENFFASMGTTIEEEMARYHAVIFFESAAVGGLGVEGGNPTRVESIEAARALDGELRYLYHDHPNFTLVHHDASFMKKLTSGVEALRMVLNHTNGD